MSKNKRNTTQQGVLFNTDEVLGSSFEHETDAAEAFLNRWEDKEDPSSSDQGKEVEVPKEDTDSNTEDQHDDTEEASSEDTTDDEEQEEQESDGDDTEEDTEEEQEEASEDDTEEDNQDESQDKEETPKVLEDTSLVQVKVNGEVKQVPVKELTRLYGKEASITQKEQKVAARGKEVEAQGAKYAAGLEVLYQKAQARWEPYSKIDMLLASKELDTEQFAELRKNAQEAYEEFQFVTQEAENFMQQMEQQRQAKLQASATEAVKVLKEKIPNWNNEVYDKIRAYSIESGMPAEIVNQIVDPYALMLLNKARLYDESKKIKLKKKAKVPTKVLKTRNTAPSDFTVDKSKSALDKLKMSGDAEDAAEAFLSRWQQ